MVLRLTDLPAGTLARMRQGLPVKFPPTWGSMAREGRRGQDAHATGGGRRRGGRRAQAAGESFQKEIMRVASAVDSVVALEELPRSGARFHGKGKAHPEKVPCDLIGCSFKNGSMSPDVHRAVFLDAKACGPEIGALRAGDPKIVKAHQAKFLARMHAAGAMAGLLVKCEAKGDVRFLPGCLLVGIEGRITWDNPGWLVLGPVTHWDFRPLLAAYAAK